MRKLGGHLKKNNLAALSMHSMEEERPEGRVVNTREDNSLDYGGDRSVAR